MNSSSAELELSRALSNQTTIVERNNNNKRCVVYLEQEDKDDHC
jgi:hypothetical protein